MTAAIDPPDLSPAEGYNDTLNRPIAPDGRPQLGRVYTIPARCGRAVRLEPGEILRLINPTGSQVCDFWAFAYPDLQEFLSMEHLRTALGRIVPRPGNALISNRRRPILVLEEDTSPGVHDTVIAACDQERYRQLGAAGHHDNCADNLKMALQALGLEAPEIPCPFNVWMNVPIGPDGAFEWLPPVAGPGDHVVLRAERACVAVMSACPQDMTPVNGARAKPQALAFQVLG